MYTWESDLLIRPSPFLLNFRLGTLCPGCHIKLQTPTTIKPRYLLVITNIITAVISKGSKTEHSMMKGETMRGVTYILDGCDVFLLCLPIGLTLHKERDSAFTCPGVTTWIEDNTYAFPRPFYDNLW